jgi:hypothetical protein
VAPVCAYGKRYSRRAGPAQRDGWSIELEDGRVLVEDVRTVEQPTLAKVGNVDGRPGDELFVASRATSIWLDLFTCGHDATS